MLDIITIADIFDIFENITIFSNPESKCILSIPPLSQNYNASRRSYNNKIQQKRAMWG